MKKMNVKFVAGTAFALGAAAALTGCCAGLPQPCVYGPAPSDLIEEIIEEHTGSGPEHFSVPEETFNVETEVMEDVYGPPEYFEGD